MVEVVKRAHQEVRVRVVQRLTVCNDLHPTLVQQRHALIDDEIMKPATAAGLELVRADFN